MLVGEGGFGVVGGEVLLKELGEGLGGFEVGAGLGVGGEGLIEGSLISGGKGFAEGVGGEVFGVHKMKVCSCSVFRVRRWCRRRSIFGGGLGRRGG